MAIAVGVWIALAGALALLVGVAARRHARRLRGTGVRAWATAVHRPHPRGSQRVSLQYTLADGRVLERPLPARRAALLSPGKKVLVWYDPKDPTDVLVYGRDGRMSDLAFIIVGLTFMIIGTVIAAFTS
jgi:hypothetical protein